MRNLNISKHFKTTFQKLCKTLKKRKIRKIDYFILYINNLLILYFKMNLIY